MNLSANQGRATMEKKRLKWKAEGSTGSGTFVRGGPVDDTKLVVELVQKQLLMAVVREPWWR